MIDTIECHLTDALTLEMIAQTLNYSPYYCSKQFRKYTGISLRSYICLRKLSMAVIELRDTNERILDIAIKYGFSSQEAFTRSFIKAFGLSPSEYRKMPKALPLLAKRNVFNPYYIDGMLMEGEVFNEIEINIQMIPEHNFVGIRSIDVSNYNDFWALTEKKNINCHTVCGLLDSIKSYNGQIGGWFYENGKKGYCYGIEVSADFDMVLPDYLECLYIPESLYVVFRYPPYEYEQIETSVYNTLIETMNGWKPELFGFKFNDALNPTYQRHNPDSYGQAICRPINVI